MDNMSPQQHHDSLSRDSGGQQESKRRTKSQSYRRQSAPSLVISKALIRSKTLSRESFLVPVCPESCPLVQSLLAGSDRSFLLHGHAQLKTGMQTQDRHLFLFSDILMIAKAKSANHFKQKAQVCVCEMWTAGCMDEVCEGSTNPEKSFVMGWPTCNCVATFSSAELKEGWLSLLKSRIKEEKEKEEPKTIPLRVYGKGINAFAVTKTLPVSNSDSTNEVIRLALQQFSIIGNVKDFQLWVISKRDNTPYPLIGHEFPFSIQMSHVRHSMSQGGGGRDSAPPGDRHRATQAEQLQVHKQCQFILKPRPAETPQQHASAEFSQKPFKRRRSLMNWAFWRGSSSHLCDLPLTGAARGCLFSQPLSCICVGDALPKPVMDMLAFLYHEGSWTRGIFRRPAGARAVRELRDTLDAGEFELPLTRDHVFIIAGVFKDFLRSIPGSLLCCEMHEEWMDVLEEEDEEEEQAQDVKRMILRLPKENTLLLRYLLAMLHGIQGNAQENQMTSFNLSVCIAPSMLWPPGAPCSPEVEGEGTKRVCELVKFMIEHCQQILGEDPSSLFGGPPQQLSTDETGSDSWPHPLTDSSYDSLENELDTSSGGSPSFCSSRRLRPKAALQGSLDSILTFSDYDPEPRPPRQGAPPLDPTLDSLSLDGGRRRRSEPAIAYLTKFAPCISESTDGVGSEEEELCEKLGSHALTHATGQSRGGGAEEASSSSLSSTSPAPNRSSQDSLDSLPSPTQGLHPTKTHVPSSPGADVVAHNWGSTKGCMGLHPNSWLKKGRRLSLTQQDNLETEDEKTAGEHTSDKSLTVGKLLLGKAVERGKLMSSKAAGSHVRPRPAQEPHKPLQQDCSTGKVQPSDSPPAVSNHQHRGEGKHSGMPLSLFRQHKALSVEEKGNSRLYQRRGSEPGHQVVNHTTARARLPSDPGLKVSQVDSQGGTESHFCLSPYATKAVKEYFSSHPHSNPQSSQQVALALVDSHREWLRRCTDPSAEPDFDKLLFSEESYV